MYVAIHEKKPTNTSVLHTCQMFLELGVFNKIFTLSVPIIIHNESEQETAWTQVYSKKTTNQSIPVITAWQLNERMFAAINMFVFCS